jgi:DNA-binding NarL/FixJ family response regulator
MSPREELNSREIRVATMVWEGKTNPEIALLLETSEQVVKNRLRSVFDKLGYGAGWNLRCMWPRTAVQSGREACSSAINQLPASPRCI